MADDKGGYDNKTTIGSGPAEREPTKIRRGASAEVAALDDKPEAPKKGRAAIKPVTRDKAVSAIVTGLTWANDMAIEFAPIYGTVPGLALNAAEIRMEAEALADLPYIRKLVAVSGINNPYLRLLWVNVVIVGRRVKLYREMKGLAASFGVKTPQDAQDLMGMMSTLLNTPGAVPEPATVG